MCPWQSLSIANTNFVFDTWLAPAFILPNEATLFIKLISGELQVNLPVTTPETAPPSFFNVTESSIFSPASSCLSLFPLLPPVLSSSYVKLETWRTAFGLIPTGIVVSKGRKL